MERTTSRWLGSGLLAGAMALPACVVPTGTLPPSTEFAIPCFSTSTELRAATGDSGVSQDVIALPDAERPSSCTTFKDRLSLALAANEATGRILNFTRCLKPEATELPAGISVRFYSMKMIRTTQPSYTGAPVGNHYDPLVPYASSCLEGAVFADITVAKGTAPGTYPFRINDLPVTVTVNTFQMPDLPSMPFYAGFSSYSVLSAHRLSRDSHVDVQAPLAMKYINLLREHRIEPYGQRISNPPVADGTLNVDDFLSGSFRQTTLSGALGPVCMNSHDPRLQNETYHQAIERFSRSSGVKGWNYLMDEPKPHELDQVLRLAQESKRHAPELKTMVTHEPTEALLPYVDHFAVNFESFGTPGHWQDYSRAPNYWLYGSCTSHGSCVNGAPGVPTGSPALLIDAPSIFARMYPVVAAALGAKAALYYDATYQYGMSDPWTDQYQFGGNGEGQLVYPAVAGERGFTSHDALPSYRLKMIRQGMYDAEYLLKQGKGSLVTDQFRWTKSHAELDALRGR